MQSHLLNRILKYFLIQSAIFFTAILPCQAQSVYADLNEEQKQLILDESFNSNENGWLTDRFVKVSGGYLKIDGKGDRAGTYMNYAFDRARDFEIEFNLAYFNKIADFHIILGDYYFNFLIGSSIWSGGSKNKQFWVGESGGSRNGLKPGKQTELTPTLKIDLEEEIYNLITIRKSGNNCFVFFNKTFITQFPIKSFDNKKIGIYADLQKINVDYIRIFYLEKPGAFITHTTKTVPADRATTDKNNIEIKSIRDRGKYYGLIIGVSDYNEPKLQLDNPVNDAVKFKEILVSRYAFPDSTMFLVLNPTRQKIISEIFRLRKLITQDDNLLIFFAGHGYWDEEARQGYWWPRDASTEDPANWLSNSDLREQIRSIKSAHTLLISDACFSGGIFKTRGGNDLMNAPKDIQMLYRLPSRRAMTSGTMTTVPDKSIFLEFLCKRLLENKEKFLSSQQLFDSFRSAVMNNTNAVPQDGVIAETGDEGGDFIFILRDQ